ncbi:MAG: hypothetical protein G8D91_00345 [gamma proteobacterium symbiont of Clathrolucina costata]
MTGLKIAEIAEIVAGLEDGGVFHDPADMRKLLAGTEHLRDSHPQIAYYWGWLEGMEAQQLIAAAA